MGIDWAEGSHLRALGRPDDRVIDIARVEHEPVAVFRLVAPYAGNAPVTRRSGKSELVAANRLGHRGSVDGSHLLIHCERTHDLAPCSFQAVSAAMKSIPEQYADEL